VNKFLRTASTRRLLGAIAGVIVAIAAGTAIAIAAQGSGPVPQPKRLARAVHDALAAPKVQGISADITFTNRLINTSEIQGSDPLLGGGSGRLWLSSDGRFRLELNGDNGDPAVVVNKTSWWVSDPASKTVYEGTLPAGTRGAADKRSSKHESLPSVAQIQTDLNKLMTHVNVSGAAPGDIAGQPAYTVRVSPKHDGGLLGEAQLAWDAVHGVPLRAAVYARGDSTPVLELAATGITYGPVDSSIFSISPPSGSKVVKVATPAGNGAATHSANGKGRSRKKHTEVSGVKAVASRLPFTLVAPKKLVGLPRRSATLLDWGGHPAALLAYGQNLGGIAVIEQAATATSAQNLNLNTGSGGERRGLSLPTVSIGGATGQELDTALGTLVRFTRGGVTYTVVGSVTPFAADAAARAL
jgi:outer membrane lipoprotein-sorting protein